MTKVFVSYSKDDDDFVERLVRDLEQAGNEVWYDQRIMLGESWIEAINKALEDAAYIIAVLSPSYLESNWGWQELNVGLYADLEKRATLVPLLIHDCELPPLFEPNRF